MPLKYIYLILFVKPIFDKVLDGFYGPVKSFYPSSRSCTFARCLSSTCVYICVVVIDACPSNVCTALMSAHFFINVVAKLCLSVCGVTFLLMPQNLAYFLTISAMLFLLRCSPNPFLERLMKRYGLSSLLFSVYVFKASIADFVANTERSFDHFPTTENWLESSLMSCFLSWISSVTLSPVPYKNCKIAKSLACWISFLVYSSGAARILPISLSSR